MSNRFGFGDETNTPTSADKGVENSSFSISVDSEPLWEARQRLTLVPTFVAIVALAASSALVVVGRTWPLPLLGWLLTPFVVVGCLVWARALSIRSAANPMFDREEARKRLVVLQILTFLAFLVSLPHVWRIGQEVALWLQ